MDLTFELNENVRYLRSSSLLVGTCPFTFGYRVPDDDHCDARRTRHDLYLHSTYLGGYFFTVHGTVYFFL
jgi:hypothetical protein